MLNNQKIGFIGAGNMASSLIGGLIHSGVSAKSIYAFDADSLRLKDTVQKFLISPATDNASLVCAVDICVIALKPQVMKKVLTPLIQTFCASKPLVLSVAAGIDTKNLESWTGNSCPIIRVMPNTPALIGYGASGLFTDIKSPNAASEAQKQLAESIVKAVGVTAWVNNEEQIDTITALSGSGPAYFFYMMEVLVKAAVKNGLSSADAKKLCIQTALGAANMAQNQTTELDVLRKNVTSPGGTTEQGINTMQQHHFEQLMQDTVNAAQERSIELAKTLGDK